MNVRIERLTKRFASEGAPAVHEAIFEAPDGGITTLLGPSGSGKTTILRVIAGLESADSGRVLVGGEDVMRLPVRQRGFGFVFQSFALFDHLSVRENIAFGLRVKRKKGPEIDERVEELLTLVQLQGHGDKFPAQLSGGQRQRVGFARALAPRPRVLLLDEPFGALDARVRAELRDWLRHLHEVTHVTTILVTHDQEEALDLSDQLVVMNLGHVEQVGSPAEVYAKPATSFVASFVGAANVLRGRVLDGHVRVGELALPVADGTLDGARVQAVVRPHDVRIERSDGAQVTRVHGRSTGRVQRIVDLGTHFKVDLDLPTRENITVHLPRREFESLAVRKGEAVLVDLDNAKVFVDDYVI
jgi:sulfate/thiosulfate transport system ATP-binding protein